MNSTILEGYNSISACLKSQSRDIFKILIDETLSERKPKALYPLKAKAEKLNIPVEYVSAEEIEKLSSGKTHGGVIAFCGERKFLSIHELLNHVQKGFLVYLDGIEDPFNFGQAVRAIYAAGADGLLLPKRNWMSAASTVARSSAGASELIPAATIEHEDISLLIDKGYKIVCSALTDDAVNYSDANLKYPLLLIIGGEKRGISASVSKFSDKTIKISYGRDFNMSLGASVAAGILAFEILRQNK